MRGRGNRGAAETENGAVCFETFVGDHQYGEARSSGLAGGLTLSKRAVCAPLCTLQSAEEVGFPKGTVNIVTGAGDTGRAVVEHEDVDKVAFTGSTEVGRSIARAVAGTQKKLTLELGGKAANIVFDDAPIDQAVEGIVQGIFFNQGHVCCAGSRLLVQESIHDEVIASLQRRIGTLRVRLDDNVIAEQPLIALEPVAQGGWFGRAWDTMRLWFK